MKKEEYNDKIKYVHYFREAREMNKKFSIINFLHLWELQQT